MIEIKFNYNTSLDNELASILSSIYLHKINLIYGNTFFKKDNWGELVARMQEDFKAKSSIMLGLERDDYFVECKILKSAGGLVLNLLPNCDVLKPNGNLDLRPYLRIALDLTIYAEIVAMRAN